MQRRKHISWKTKCASALLFASPMMYDDAKNMTEDQFLSLFEWDHNMFVSSGHEDIDKFWNLTPLFRKAHREKTKQDAKIIAKGKRIRAKNKPIPPVVWEVGPTIGAYWMDRKTGQLYEYYDGGKRKRVSKIRSRGFDKTRSRKMSGKVVKRER